MINENEVYSLRQLEAFNALSQNEKLNLQLKVQKREETPTYANFDASRTTATAHIKSESEDDYSRSLKLSGKQIESVKLPETPIRRVLIANQLTGATVAKSTPKAVTASVFKTIPAGVKPFKAITSSSINNGAIAVAEPQLNNGTISRAAQSVTASLIQPISAAVKRDSYGKIQPTIATEALVSRPSVVTASLFQPRAGINNAAPAKLIANQFASRAEAMNKSFCMLSDDLCQPTASEYKQLINSGRVTTRKLQSTQTATN